MDMMCSCFVEFSVLPGRVWIEQESCQTLFWQREHQLALKAKALSRRWAGANSRLDGKSHLGLKTHRQRVKI
jgi:hypothetical protein